MEHYKTLISRMLQEKGTIEFNYKEPSCIFANKMGNSLYFCFSKEQPEITTIITYPKQLTLEEKEMITQKTGFGHNKKKFVKKIQFKYTYEQILKNKNLYLKIQKHINEQIIIFESIITNIILVSTFEKYKILSLNIEDFNQFKDFYLDLTYPIGHKKAGKPLDKICLIGQNGTGKTTLQKLIYLFIKQPNQHRFYKKINQKVSFEFEDNKKKKIKIFYENEDFNSVNPLDMIIQLSTRLPSRVLEKNLINFPANIIEKPNGKSLLAPKKGIIDFNVHSAIETWKFVKAQIIEHNNLEKVERDKFKKIAEISHIESAETIQKVTKKLTDDFTKWKKNNINPVIKLSEKLKIFLKRFNLRIKTEKIDFNKIEEIENIRIETLQGEELGNLEEVLSTGTKQILYTAMPLYTLESKNAIILFDEPERSLYPDIQKEIIDFYTSLSPDSQFFFATHSPIIASNFEPWEIVELKFNKDTGKVYQNKWYEGERHVDNYFKDARYLSWDDIFMEMFGLKQDGSKLRINKLMEVASLKKNLEKGNFKEKEHQKKYKEYKQLAKLINYNFG